MDNKKEIDKSQDGVYNPEYNVDITESCEFCHDTGSVPYPYDGVDGVILCPECQYPHQDKAYDYEN